MKRILIAGGGAAGISAALAAAEAGAEVTLVEMDGGLGGDLFSGMPLLGAFTAKGVQISHGILDELLDSCRKIHPAGVIGPVCDYRTVVGLCLDPEVLRLAVCRLIGEHHIKLLLNTMIIGAEVRQGVLESVLVRSKNREYILPLDAAVDATGGGYLSAMCGCKVFFGSEDKTFQPASLIFRMCGVDYGKLLQHIRNHPEDVLLCENSALPADRREAAELLARQGMPYAAFAAESSLLAPAMKSGRLHPCTAAFITPTAPERGEVCLNVTRAAGVDCSDDAAVSGVLPVLAGQVIRTAEFFRKEMPGFADASVSHVFHKCGVRESGRIDGEAVLKQEDVISAAVFPDAVAQGCHHVDIHGSGTAQIRIPVRDGLAYDIPRGALCPKGLKNVFAAGRCISSDRGANGSARVMGTCISTGQAAAKLAAEI